MRFLPDHSLEHLRQVMDTPDLSSTRYQLQAEIGRGGMGTVYKAWDSQLDRQVAIKVMDAGYAINDEAKLLARLEHPGLAPVYDSGDLPDGRIFYAMRLIEGRGLDEFLRQESSLTVRLRVFERICDTMAFAHDRGVLHCDLKPQNIMVGNFGQVFVLDWGVARAITAGPLPSAGTPHYMPPEQSGQPPGPLDARTDVFALGRILQDLMPPLPPRALAAIARKATSAVPSDRFPDVRRLAEDVDLFLDGLPVTAYQDTLIERLIRFGQRNQVLLLLLGTYLIVKLFLFFLGPPLK